MHAPSGTWQQQEVMPRSCPPKRSGRNVMPRRQKTFIWNPVSYAMGPCLSVKSPKRASRGDPLSTHPSLSKVSWGFRVCFTFVGAGFSAAEHLGGNVFLNLAACAWPTGWATMCGVAPPLSSPQILSRDNHPQAAELLHPQKAASWWLLGICTPCGKCVEAQVPGCLWVHALRLLSAGSAWSWSLPDVIR